MHRRGRLARRTRFAPALLIVGFAALPALRAVPAQGVSAPRPILRIAASAHQLTVGQRIDVDLRRSSVPVNNRLRRMTISFGDHTPDKNLATARVRVRHVYRRAGVYTVRARAVDLHQRVLRVATNVVVRTRTGVGTCGEYLCVGGRHWASFGATFYNPGLKPIRSGIKDPAGTVALALQAHLNTLRITNFLASTGDPSTSPYDETRWARVDAMIAAAGAAGLHVDLGLADYRNMMWNSCINPYTADWRTFETWVANRVNTVTGIVYKNDPTIALVSIAGEPKPVGTYAYTASATGEPCTIKYSTQDLTNFYAASTSAWAGTGGSVLVNSGGLGYLNEPSSGIDWEAIFSLPNNAICDVKTYGGMLAWAPNAASYCHGIGKPIIDEEYGWQQSSADATRAAELTDTAARLKAAGFAGSAFWNLGYQLASTSYEINPDTPLAFAAVRVNAP
jgi:hypothetical protein